MNYALMALAALLAVAVYLAFKFRRLFVLQSEDLRLEKERWTLLLEANQDGIFDVDLRTGSAVYSPHWTAQIGYSPADWAPTEAEWLKRIHPADRATVENSLNEYLERRVPSYDIEYRLQHRSGDWRWIHARAQAVWDKNGQAVRLVGSHADITNRKQAEAELKASEAQLRTFLDNNPALTYIKDEDGRLLYLNQAAPELFGQPLEDLIGKFDVDILPADLAACVRQMDRDAFAFAPAVSEILHTVVLPDNNVRELLTRKFVFADASGKSFLGGISVDVTELRNAQSALRDSEERYRELFNRNPVPAIIYNPETLRIHDANETAIDQYGWSREEFLNLKVSDIRLPEEVEAIEADLRKQTGMRSGPWHHRRKDGSTIWVNLIARDMQVGTTPMRLMHAGDNTARIEAEQAVKLAYERMETLVEQRTAELRESELKWRALVESTPQIVYTAQPNGVIDYINPRGAEFMGASSVEQLTSADWFEVLHPSDRSRVYAAWHAALQSASVFDFEVRMRSKTGEYCWFKTVGKPILNAEGKVVRLIGASIDIDDQKRSEEALEIAVARRTMELAEARDRAEAATRAKTQFLAAMSHEIRTPMNGVIGMANIMLDTELTSQQRCYMDTIRSSGEALLTVINDILDLSKIEAGKLDLDRTPFDLSTLVEESMEVVATQASAKNLALHCDIDHSIPLDLIGDSARLRQVLLNLLNNAVKFTTHGAVSLSISREANQEHMTVLRFAIRDTGIGLSQKQQDKLFQAYQQADLSTGRRYGGTGLGLTISKRLVEMMGGSIGVHSKIGEGSTFWFNVCLETAPVFADTRCVAGKRVALVSTETKTSATLCSYLEAVGLQVTIYARVPRPEHSFYHLLLVDSEVIQQSHNLAQLTTHLQGPILVLGAQADLPAPSVEGLSKLTFVPKPVRRLPLLRAIQSVFDDKSAGAGSVESAIGRVKINASILLAEDNKINQVVARVLLERIGCRVTIVENGVEACSAIQQNAYDVVLMDCQMPVMSGFEATKRIRSLETSGRRTPIIALTAGVLQEERERCYACGMDDFLSKPISPNDLEHALERWISVPSTA